jgi:hypothetical protein
MRRRKGGADDSEADNSEADNKHSKRADQDRFRNGTTSLALASLLGAYSARRAAQAVLELEPRFTIGGFRHDRGREPGRSLSLC